MNKAEILAIDDEPAILKLLEINLLANDFKVLKASNGAEGLRLARSHAPQLILLDLGLPDVQGLTLLKELKTWYHKPIIVVSAVQQESIIIDALDSGAADYLTKPFRTGELLARIRSSLRRYYAEEDSGSLRCRGLQLDPSGRSITLQGIPLRLTATEFDLLALFMRNEGRVLTHQYILREVWGQHHEQETQYLRVFVGALRKKIETEGQATFIHTEIGIGYRFA